jgi:dTDP-4-dehydrorhamnose 3,5-epimerase
MPLMKIETTALSGVLVVRPRIFHDARGFFLESWNQKAFDQAVGRKVRFVQDNHSRSRRGVLRGLHYQVAPAAQGKLVTVMSGKIFDVAVDLRSGSPTSGQWFGEELCGDQRSSLWIPEGFAHGFVVLSEEADVLYKTTEFYSPENERCIRWDDNDLDIEWPLSGITPLVSAKDAAGISFKVAMLSRKR